MFVRKKLTSTSGIYQIQSIINGKRYIGSAINFKNRRNGHIFKLRRIEHNNAHLQNHVNKYGLKDLEFAIIEFCSKDKLVEREQFYISTLKPEFNIRKKAESNFGLKASEETLQRMRESNSFPIDQYSLTGKFIKSYSSTRHAGKQNKISSTTISACLNNNRSRSAGGFIWVRKGESVNKKLDKFNNKFQHLLVPVYQYNLKGELVSSYKSVMEAANQIGTSPHIMSSYVCGKLKTLHGFIWKKEKIVI